MAAERAEEGSFRQSTRAPVEAVVRLHFEGALASESGFSANVSSSGMFVRHTEPREPGSRLTFEFQVGKERLPVLGTGEVVWLRERYEGPGKPPGMGIQFTNLDALSRQNLTMALFEFLEESLSLLPELPQTPAIPELARIPEIHESTEPAALDPGPAVLLPALESRAPFAPVAPVVPPAAPREEILSPPSEPTLAVPTEPTPEAPPALIGERSGANLRPPKTRRPRLPWIAGIALLFLVAGVGLAWWLERRDSAREASADTDAAVTAAAPPSSTSAAAAPAPATAASGPAAAPPAPSAEVADSLATPPVGISAATSPRSPAAEGDGAPGAFQNVSRISWEEVDGATWVTVLTDGIIPEGRYDFSKIGGESPRLVLRFFGVRGPYPKTRYEVGTSHVKTIRTGVHSGARGEELHVVIDLAAANLAVADHTPAGSRIVLKITR